MDKYIQVKITDKDIHDAVTADIDYSEAVKKLVLFYIQCESNGLDIDKMTDYTGTIISDVEKRVAEKSIDSMIDETVAKGKELNHDEFEMLKENGLLDDFLKRATERGLGKHSKNEDNDEE